MVELLEGSQFVVEEDFVDLAFEGVQLDDFYGEGFVGVEVAAFVDAGGVALAEQVFGLEDVVFELLDDAGGGGWWWALHFMGAFEIEIIILERNP